MLYSPPLIAPFWDDVDITKGGNITYRGVTDDDTLDNIRQEIFIQYPELGNARPSYVFLATWEHVPPSSAIASSNHRNTFQAYIATNGSWSVVRFCYGSIDWASNSTVIGVSAGGFRAQEYVTHPASLNSHAVRQLNGSTVFYRIDRGIYDTIVITNLVPGSPIFSPTRVVETIGEPGDEASDHYGSHVHTHT